MKTVSSGSRGAHFAQRVVVFGGSGSVGTSLAWQLTQSGTTVTIGDLQRSRQHGGVWRFCDVRDLPSVLATAAGAEVIINLAAEHGENSRPASRYQETNVDGARNVCAAARELGINTILVKSSVSVYGFPAGPVSESFPTSPVNEYGRTKLEAEAIYSAWAAEDPSRSLVIVRPSVVFGEGNRGNVYLLLRQIASGRFFMVGEGSDVKSVAYAENLAGFLAHILDSGPGVHLFNYADTPDMSTAELVATAHRLMGKTFNGPTLPVSGALLIGRAFDAVARLSGFSFPVSADRIRKFCSNTRIDATKAMQTGFVPPYSMEAALARTIQAEFPGAAMQPAPKPVQGDTVDLLRRTGAA